MTNHIPRHALSLLANTANLARKYGLKKGMSKAAARVNPALLLLEAAVSVAGAVDSYVKLKEQRAHRDGLTRFIPYEEKRLKIEREKLKEQIALAKRELDNKIKVQQALGELVLVCSAVYRAAWNELHKIRNSDLPDIEAFDEQLIVLEDVWSDLHLALQNYNETSV